MPISEAIRQFAEEPDFEQPEPWLPGRIIRRPAFTLRLTPDPHNAGLTRVRTTVDGLDATIAEARAVLREHGFLGCAWCVGPSCQPAGLAELLVGRGFVPAGPPSFEPSFQAMAMASAPETSASPGVEARPVRSIEEYILAVRVGLEAHGETEEMIEGWIKSAPVGWNHANGIAKMTHIVFVDGQAAGAGFVSYGNSAILLGGAGVLPAHRGRGAYRALIASRWQTAIEVGKPALVIHAGAMSRPILERCGFEPVCRVDLFLDPALAAGA